MQEKVDFGFEKVTPGEKDHRVRGVFAAVAQNYDIMNDAMSLGVHRLWKRAFVSRAKVRPSHKVLDLAGGTGDVAFRLIKAGAEDVTVCDPSAEMMAVGEDRAVDHGHLKGLKWVCAPAEELPFKDNSFDLVTISFGLRNVTDRAKGLTEAHRVLKTGGKFMCLEFSQMQLPLMDKLYEAYSFNVIPKLGGMIANDEESYKYLVESIATFPTQEQLVDMMKTAGFDTPAYQNLSGGIAAIHTGWKL